MDYSIFDARRAGFDRGVFIIRRDFEAAFRAQISNRFASTLRVDHAFQSPDDLPAPYTCPSTREKPWGTAHALLAARDLLTDPCVVINADDFYGLESFQNHAKFFDGNRMQSNAIDSIRNPRFAMAGYTLRATLSPHGTVARGVCRASATNLLLSIREHTKIRATPNGAEDIADPANPVPFTGGEPVSLNNFAFTPAVVGLLTQYFCGWLCQNEGNPALECYLPTAVGHFITHNLATVAVLPCSAPWFGVTYQDDVPGVKARLAAPHAEGCYPSKLW
jgi:hypothetical protein